MAHTNLIDKTNTTKSNTYNNQSSNENTEELYNDLMNTMECFSVLGFLLAGLVNYAFHENRISD